LHPAVRENTVLDSGWHFNQAIHPTLNGRISTMPPCRGYR
jgi:hypothetical protein